MLDGSYIHDECSEKGIGKLRKKLIKEEIAEVFQRWASNIEQCLPAPLGSNEYDEGDHGIDEAIGENVEIIKERARTMDMDSLLKAPFVDEILSAYWPQGLNLYQVAEIDCVDCFGNNFPHTWSYSTFADNQEEEVVPTIEAHSFVKAIEEAFQPITIGHIFAREVVHLHNDKDFNLVVVRIQLFTTGSAQKTTPLVPLRPIYLIFPQSSPHVIHTAPGNDLNVRSALQALRTILAPLGGQLSLNHKEGVTTRDLIPLCKSLGASRSASAHGQWSTYAFNLADTSPLDYGLGYNSQKRKSGLSSRQRLANVRFTGDQYQSPTDATCPPLTQFSSTISEPVNGAFSPSIKLDLEGTDVFKGMYHLTVEGVVDGALLPDWLTGSQKKF